MSYRYLIVDACSRLTPTYHVLAQDNETKVWRYVRGMEFPSLVGAFGLVYSLLHNQPEITTPLLGRTVTKLAPARFGVLAHHVNPDTAGTPQYIQLVTGSNYHLIDSDLRDDTPNFAEEAADAADYAKLAGFMESISKQLDNKGKL